MEKIGFDGFNWEEVEVAPAGSKGKNKADIYLYMYSKLKQTYVKAEYLEMAGIKPTDRLQLMAQGSAILMFKVQKGGAIGINPVKGKYCRLGGADLTSKLNARCNTQEFEVVEAADGYIMFRPIR